MSGHKCFYNKCGLTTRNVPDLRLFRFPVKDPIRCKQWIIHSGNITLPGLSPKSLSKKFLCNRHFKPQFLQNKRLPLNAVPDKYLAQNESEDEDVEKENLIIEQSMVRRTYSAPCRGSNQQDQPSTSFETLSTDMDHDSFSGPNDIKLDIENRFDVEQDTCNNSHPNGDVETDLGTNQVVKQEMDSIFNVVQEDCKSDELNGESGKSHSVNNHISQIGLVEAVPNRILNHNRLISVAQLSTKELNDFVGKLPSRDVKTLHFSQNSEQTTEKKRIILVGSTLKCKFCTKYFLTRGRHDRHMRTHKRLEQRQTKRDNLQKQKLEEKKNRRLNAQMNPTRRMKESKPKLDLECKTCFKICSSRDDLAIHVKIHPPFVCDKCGKGFAYSGQVKVHQDVHNDPNSFLCEVCGKGYKALGQLRAHKLLHENNSVMCSKCPKVFNTGIKLRKHLKYTHGEGLTNLWSCGECQKVFKQPAILNAHYRHMHLKENQHICAVCGQGFFRLDYLKRHERRHIMYGDKLVKKRQKPDSYQCQICTKVFKTITNLKLHIRRHGTLSRFSCKYCSMTFKIKYQRNRHEKLHEHSDLKYRCGICWKRLETQEELDHHSLTHNNLKYKCDICGQSFARKHLFDDHIVNSHTENGDAEEEMRTLLAAGLGELHQSNI